MESWPPGVNNHHEWHHDQSSWMELWSPGRSDQSSWMVSWSPGMINHYKWYHDPQDWVINHHKWYPGPQEWSIIMNGIMSGLGICSSDFWVNRSFFAKKWGNEWLAQKNEHFAKKNELFAQKMSNLLICSFLVSNLSDWLMVAHFWWATWAIRSQSSPKKREWANRSFFLTNLAYIKHSKKWDLYLFSQNVLNK